MCLCVCVCVCVCVYFNCKKNICGLFLLESIKHLYTQIIIPTWSLFTFNFLGWESCHFSICLLMSGMLLMILFKQDIDMDTILEFKYNFEPDKRKLLTEFVSNLIKSWLNYDGSFVNYWHHKHIIQGTIACIWMNC